MYENVRDHLSKTPVTIDELAAAVGYPHRGRRPLAKAAINAGAETVVIRRGAHLHRAYRLR